MVPASMTLNDLEAKYSMTRSIARLSATAASAERSRYALSLKILYSGEMFRIYTVGGIE